MRLLIFTRLAPTTSIPNAGQLWNLIPGPLCGAVDVIQVAIIYTLRPIFLSERKSLTKIVSSNKISLNPPVDVSHCV